MLESGSNHFWAYICLSVLALNYGLTLASEVMGARMKIFSHKPNLAIPGLLAWFLIQPASAGFTWPGCSDVAEKDFRYQSMVGRGAVTSPKIVDPTISEPIHMAFDLQADNSTDIYWCERHGGIKRYIAGKNQVVKLGLLEAETSPNARDEQGLTGITLDPDFHNNHWLYLYYSPAAENNVFRVSRFTLNVDFTTIDFASEKVLLRIPSQRVSCCHTAGAMAFDLHKDLWIAVGKNSPDYPASINESNEAFSSEGTSADASDMRGGIVRIHPDNSDKGYSVPQNNYGEYWSNYFKSKGNATVAAEYSDPAKVLPEIYVKGARNPYSLTVDPVKRWVSWGEFGVNLDATMTEEHNLVTHPVNGGYPYFSGGGGTGGSGCTYLNGMCELWRAFGTSAGDKDRNAPVNNSKWNKGPKLMPPVEPALHTYPRSGAITGPIYRYDGASPSTIKFPPHFENTWFVGDLRKQWIKIYKLNETGDRLMDSLTWFTNYKFYDVLDIQQAPDGALYILNYSGDRSSTAETSIGRIEYVGSCRPAEPKYPTLPDVGVASFPKGTPNLRIDFELLKVEGSGTYELKINDAQGRIVTVFSGFGSQTYSMKRLRVKQAGLYFATLIGAWGARTQKIVTL
jgi:cytochrome c